MPTTEPMPAVLAPMLATAGPLPPPEQDRRYAYEFKWDGVRAVAHVDRGSARLLSRNDHDVVGAYPELDELWRSLSGRRVVLDGEVVATDPVSGRISFGALQSRMHVTDRFRARRLATSTPVTYLVFDVLYLDGRSSTSLTYVQRRELLAGLRLAGPRWAVPPSFTGGGSDVLAASREQQLEGVMAKQLVSAYEPGRRTGSWVKVKNVRAQTVVVGGWTPGQGNRTGTVGALLVGIPGPEGLEYAGNVGTGFSRAALADLLSRLQRRERATSPFTGPVPARAGTGARWTVPELVGEVEYAEWTRDGRLRHPTWRGLRPDRSPADVEREG
jgi:bifunctional non-homologous end joining protein LigD